MGKKGNNSSYKAQNNSLKNEEVIALNVKKSPPLEKYRPLSHVNTQDSLNDLKYVTTQNFLNDTILTTPLLSSTMMDSNDEVGPQPPQQDIPIYIFAKGFPNAQMNDADKALIIDKLSEKIMESFEEDGNNKMLTKTLPLDGFVKVFVANQETAIWISKVMEEFSNLIVSDNLPARVKKFTKVTLRIRKRSRTMTEEELKRQLTVRNKGLVLDGCTLLDVQDLRTRDGGEPIYRLLAWTMDEVAMKWLRENEGKVYFDVEVTRFIWDEIRHQQQGAKKAKFDKI